MAISLLNELRGEFETAFLLSYTVNLGFFEHLVLPLLQRCGVTDIALLVEHQSVQDTFASPFTPEQCGRSYVLAPVHLPHGGIQHAKILWLSGADGVTVYVGSHNLTMAGFSDHSEFTVQLCQRNPGHRQALADIHRFIGRVVDLAGVSTVQQMWKRVAAPVVDAEATVWFYDSFDVPLIEQVWQQIPQAPALRVVTPFLSPTTLAALSRRLDSDSVILDIAAEGLNVPLREVSQHLTNVTYRQQERVEQHFRLLHAKLYEMRSSDKTWLAAGSANCTITALQRSTAKGGNLEVLVLLPDQSIPEGGPDFHDIPDLDAVPVNDPSAEGENVVRQRLHVKEAVYQHNQLEVCWTTDGNPDIVALDLRIDGESVSAAGNPIVISWSRRPLRVTLSALFADTEDIETVDGWVIAPDELQRQRERARRRQLEDALASSDAQTQQEQMELDIRNVIRAFSDLLPIETREAHRAQWALAESSGARAADLHEIFDFSPNPIVERQAAAKLTHHDLLQDSFAVFRALLTRLAAPREVIASGDDEDASAVASAARQREAIDGVAVSLAYGFSQILSLRDRWTNIPRETAFGCLRFLVCSTVAMWLHGGLQACPLTTRRRLAEVIPEVLFALRVENTTRAWLLEPRVLAPLAYLLGVIQEVSGFDAETVQSCEELGRALFPKGPAVVLEEWRSRCSNDAELLLRAGASRTSVDASRLLTFLGVLSASKTFLQQKRWGLLIELHDADQKGSARRDELYRLAADKYRGEPVWQTYQGLRRARKFPAIYRAGQSHCSRCYCQLPQHLLTKVRRGDPVVCPECTSILLMSNAKGGTT